MIADDDGSTRARMSSEGGLNPNGSINIVSHASACEKPAISATTEGWEVDNPECRNDARSCTCFPSVSQQKEAHHKRRGEEGAKGGGAYFNLSDLN